VLLRESVALAMSAWSFRLHRKVERIAFQSRREVSLVDALLRFGLGQDLHHGETLGMRAEHDLDRGGIGEKENGDQDVCDEIHRCHIIVVDQDAVKRLQFGLLVGSDFDIGCGLCMDGHAGDYSIVKNPPHERRVSI
jgi:hypothetical protein